MAGSGKIIYTLLVLGIPATGIVVLLEGWHRRSMSYNYLFIAVIAFLFICLAWGIRSGLKKRNKERSV